MTETHQLDKGDCEDAGNIEKRELFGGIALTDGVRRAIEEIGYKEATMIQSQAIPVVLTGRDVIGHSQTGTGKTAAFGIPIIERIKFLNDNPVEGAARGKGVPKALILCPTRELAMQSAEEMRKFAKYTPGVRVVPVYGGASINFQIAALKRGVEIVIGTPGRVMDHMRRRTLDLSDVSMVVLDEADEMLNMGFREDIELILRDVPTKRQTLLFSATMSDEIMAITEEFLKEPVLVKVAAKVLTVESIRQYFYDVPPGRKPDALARLFDYHNPKRAMVFCNTKKTVDELATLLRARGYTVDALHGDMKQQSRTLVLDAFKNGKTPVLIATDVAARGLDVDDVDIVFNYDLPQDMEYYVHRIGRTGRAGKSGACAALVCGSRQTRTIKEIERFTHSRITSRNMPTLAEVEAAKLERIAGGIRAMIEAGFSDKYAKLIEQLAAEGFDAANVAAAVLSIHNPDERDTHIDDDFVIYEKQKAARKARGDRQRFEGRSQSDGRAKSEAHTKRGLPFLGKRPPMARLVINIGSKNGINANHIMGAVAGETGLAGKKVGSIEIGEHSTIVEVPVESANMVIAAMRGCKIKGRTTVTKRQ